MKTQDIQPLLDAEIDAVVGGSGIPKPIWIWDEIPGFPKPPWISPDDPPAPGDNGL